MRRQRSSRFTLTHLLISLCCASGMVLLTLLYLLELRAAEAAAYKEYRRIAQSTSAYLNELYTATSQSTRMLSHYPRINAGLDAKQALLPMLVEVLAAQRFQVSISISSAAGTHFEVINLNSDPPIRKTLRARPEDRWVTLSQQGTQAILRYYRDDLSLRLQRHVSRNYQPSAQPTFTNAPSLDVAVIEPHVAPHLGVPIQAFSIRRGDTVVSSALALPALNSYLHHQLPSTDGAIYLFRSRGDLIASSRARPTQRPPRPPLLPLSPSQQAWLAQLPPLRVSNEQDWAPIDFAVGGEPQGYSVDLIQLLAQQLNIEVQFVNDRSWNRLVSAFEDGQIDILQPVFAHAGNRALGAVSDAFLELPYALVTRVGQPQVSDLTQLSGQTLAIPEGWSILETLRTHYPDITLLVTPDSHAALAAVSQGKATATLDSSVVLQHSARQYFIENLVFNEPVASPRAALPQQLHFIVREELKPLTPLLNRAMQALPPASLRWLEERWQVGLPGSTSTGVHHAHYGLASTRLPTMPYARLLELAIRSGGKERFARLSLQRQPHLTYLAPLKLNATDHSYFALLVPEVSAYAAARAASWYNFAVAGVVLLVVIGLVLLLGRRLQSQHLQLQQQLLAPPPAPLSASPPPTTPSSAPKGFYWLAELAALQQGITIATARQRKQQARVLDSIESLAAAISAGIDQQRQLPARAHGRGPALLTLLIEQANQTRIPPFTQFALTTTDQLRELRVAAWLQDCGRLCLPPDATNEAILTATYGLLQGASLSPEFARIPHYATIWGEYLNGRGVRGLKADDLGLIERILAVAQVFSQLGVETDAQQQPLNVSQMITRLLGRVRAGQLDREVCALLLNNGVYRDWVQTFLQPGQWEPGSQQDTSQR